MAIRHQLPNGAIHVFREKPTGFLVVCTDCSPTVVNQLTGTEQTAITLADEHAQLFHSLATDEEMVEVLVSNLKWLAAQLHESHLPKFPDCKSELCNHLWFMLPDHLEEWSP